MAKCKLEEELKIKGKYKGKVSSSLYLPKKAEIGDYYYVLALGGIMVYTVEGRVYPHQVTPELLEKEPKTETEELRDKEELERTLGHRDTCFSIMYDLLRNDTIPDDKKLMIIKIVVDEQCGQELNLSQQIIYECYYHRVFV